MKESQLKKEYTLSELLSGLDITIKGDSQAKIYGVGTIQDATPGCITFLMNPLYKKYLETTQASAVILLPVDAEHCPSNAVITRNPYYVYAKVAAFFDQRPVANPGIHSTAVIGSDCEIHPSVSIGSLCVIGDGVKLGKNVSIGPGCVIGDYSELGEATRLDANVTLYHQVRLGKRVLVASGTVIGSDGFGIAKENGQWHKVPQLGEVIIEDDVEIGSNCSIDRGAIENTIIEKGVKLDNLIQIGHNVHIGENTAIAGCVGIAGSASIGKNCLLGGGAGVAGHVTIADNVMITGFTATTKSIREPGIYSSGVGGLVTNQEWRKNSARIQRLDKLMQRVKELETTLAALQIERKTT